MLVCSVGHRMWNTRVVTGFCLAQKLMAYPRQLWSNVALASSQGAQFVSRWAKHMCVPWIFQYLQVLRCMRLYDNLMHTRTTAAWMCLLLRPWSRSTLDTMMDSHDFSVTGCRRRARLVFTCTCSHQFISRMKGNHNKCITTWWSLCVCLEDLVIASQAPWEAPYHFSRSRVHYANLFWYFWQQWNVLLICWMVNSEKEKKIALKRDIDIHNSKHIQMAKIFNFLIKLYTLANLNL